jgi:cytochrome c556
MSRQTWVVLGSFALALGIWALAGGSSRSADDDEDAKLIKEAKEAVEQLVGSMGKGSNGKKEAEAIQKKFAELKPVMVAAFKPRLKGGMGVGPADPNDGVEIRIINWSKAKKPMTAPELAKQKETLERAAEITRSMAEVAELYAPKKAADAAKWKRYNDAMRKGSEDLAKAAKSGDAEGVKRAVTDINGSCTDCHGDFRDNN